MKRIILIVAIIATAFTQKSFAQDSTKQYQLSQLLTYYYNIKNALVAGNANDGALAASSFVKAANSIDYKVISEGNINTLVHNAGKISESKDIKKQREYFANFSTNMAAVAKAVKLTDKPVYYAYCPMKKAYWLSSEKEIKNPYYGSSMLTCGQVTETIQ
ncbi:MAG: DUF3347 domain-containing protein [Panacibacter sp.]